MTRNALGRGLSSLLGERDLDLSVEALRNRGQVQKNIPLDSLTVNPWQPRRDFDDVSLAELADSIRIHGVLQPLLVRTKPEGDGFILIAGERRLRAAKLAGLSEVPGIVLDAGELETLSIALTENIQRSDLNPIEQAYGYAALRDQFGLTQEEIAAKVGKPRSTVANFLRLLSLPTEVREALLTGAISMGHARTLAGLENNELCLRAFENVIGKGLNVRQTEELCRSLSETGSTTGESPDGASELKDPNIQALEEALRDYLGTQVVIRPKGAKGGKISIRYFDLDQLDDILSKIGFHFES